MQYTDTYQSPLGGITLACEADRLTGLWFDGQKYFGSTLAAGARREAVPVLAQAKEWLDRYFRGEDPGPLPPLELRGTPFQREVWGLLLQIPRGQVNDIRPGWPPGMAGRWPAIHVRPGRGRRRRT